MVQNNIRAVLKKHPLIPVVTFERLEDIDPMINKLLERGIQCIEITLRTAIAFEAIQYVKESFGDKIDVGVGTIIHVEQIDKCKELQVDFMVSPAIHQSLFNGLEESGIAFIPGVATPSEILHGISQAWDTFKFFPANLFGGVTALKTYGQLFSQVKFCPTGGVNQETYQDYLKLENVISVGGSWMTK